MAEYEENAPAEEDMEAKLAQDFVYAARIGDVEQVTELLAQGVPVGSCDNSGWTALKWAACEGHEEALAVIDGTMKWRTIKRRTIEWGTFI